MLNCKLKYNNIYLNAYYYKYKWLNQVVFRVYALPIVRLN